jgi:glycosyltransferase involved in cell wall biosynthesis
LNNITFIFPLYNEQKRVHLLNDFLSFLEKKIKKYEILLINNGSTDKTLSLIKNFSRKKKQIKPLNISFSSRGAAIKLGIKKSKFNIIAICSIDNSWDLNFYIKAYNIIKNDKFDIIYGPKDHNLSRVVRPYFRRTISFFCTFFLKILFGDLISEDTQCIKMFQKNKIKFLKKLSNANLFAECEFYLLGKINHLHQAAIPVKIYDTKKRVKLIFIIKFMLEAIKFKIKNFSFII